MRVWLDPDRLAVAAADGDRRRPGDPRAERPGRGRRARRAAGAERHDLPALDQRAGPAARPRTSSPTSSSAPTPDGQITRVSRRRPGRARLEPLRAAQPARQQAGGGDRHLPAARDRTRSQASNAGARDDGAAEEGVSRGRGLPHRLRPDGLRPRVDPRGRRDAVRAPSCWSSIVVMVFLQTWRASIIPLVAVPVSLVGTFAVMLVLGFSLNTLSLFGLVLAIGIVVDDAIVVVENVERHIEHGAAADRGDAARRWTKCRARSSRSRWCSCAVFVPTAFVSGLTGQFYRQFALTIAISTVISAFNSLTLSPALASRLLLPHGAPRDRLQRGDRPAVRLVLPAASTASSRAARRSTPAAWRGCCASPAVALVLYVGLIGLTGARLRAGAAGLRAGAGQGLPRRVRAAARRATLDRTDAVIRQMSRLALDASRASPTRSRFPGCRSTASSTRRTPASCS